METKSKLITLELVAGLLGWVWIGASIVTLYFLVMVIFSDGTWPPFFWAIGTSIVAKWLTRGFLDNKARVAFEAEHRAAGDTPEEAGRKWIEAYTGQAANPGVEYDPIAIVRAYGATLETGSPTPGCVADESKLPYPKSKIKAALAAALKNPQNDQVREQLKIAYVRLADWQPNVGDSDQGIDFTDVDPNQGIESLASSVLGQEPLSEELASAVRQEQETLMKELKKLGV